jgi:predicted GIY-YIG superfamily endonuclease
LFLDPLRAPDFSRLGSGVGLDIARDVPEPNRCVYILKSIRHPSQYYVGVTADPVARLEAHNDGRCPHTATHRPWRTLVVIEFDEEDPALEFERYMKTGSGREFARRHFRWTSDRPHSRRKKSTPSET